MNIFYFKCTSIITFKNISPLVHRSSIGIQSRIDKESISIIPCNCQFSIIFKINRRYRRSQFKSGFSILNQQHCTLYRRIFLQTDYQKTVTRSGRCVSCMSIDRNNVIKSLITIIIGYGRSTSLHERKECSCTRRINSSIPVSRTLYGNRRCCDTSTICKIRYTFRIQLQIKISSF